MNLKKLASIAVATALLVTITGCPPPPGPWHPELTHRPRLLYEADEEALIRERIDRAPYDLLYARVTSKANLSYHYSEGEAYDQSNECRNANIAKACAFVYAMEGDDQYADKAADLLLHLQTGADTAYNTDLYAAQSLAAYCQAFDTLLGAGYGDDRAADEMAGRIGALTDTLYTLWILGNPEFFNFWLENHQTKVASAVGMAAITLNLDDRATEWINYGVTATDLIVNRIQAPTGGGCAEGTNYYHYSAQNHFPFMWALHRFLDGAGETFSLRLGGPFFLLRIYIPGFYDDFLAMPETRDTIDWLIKVRMPDGRNPVFDDANYSHGYNGMFNGIWNDGVYAWDWIETTSPYYSSGSVDLSADLICTYDDAIAPTAPAWAPTQFMAEAGNAVFRSAWSGDASYMLLMGEHGAARVNGFGHEHPDATSFIIHAKGELLALDSGYINWEHHNLVNRARNHSLVLVDGEGPPLFQAFGVILTAGVDAFIEDGLDTAFLDACRVRTEYRGVLVERTVLFPMEDHFILVDSLQGTRTHTYEWLLHGNALEDFDLGPDGGVWTQGNAKLKAFVTTTQGPPETSSHTDVHATSYGQYSEHAVLNAASGAVAIRYLSILYPEYVGVDFPAIQDIGPAGGEAIISIDRDDGLELAFTREAAGTTVIPAAVSGIGEIETDGEIGFVKTEPSGVDLFIFFIKNGTALWYDGAQIFSADAFSDAAVEFGSSRIEGYVRPLEAGSFDLLTGVEPLSVTGANITGHQYLGNGVTRITLSAESDFIVELP